MANEQPITDETSSQPSQPEVFSCTECSYAFTSEIFLQKHIKRSHNGIYCQMLKDGQISEPSFPQITSTVTTSQTQGDPGELRSYNPDQSAWTLTQPDVKTQQRTYKRKKALICKKCDSSFNQLDDLNSHLCLLTVGKPFHCKQTYSPSPPQSGHISSLEDEPRHLDGVSILACKILQKNMERSLNYIYSRMQSRGQIPSESCQKSFNAEPRPYSNQQFTKTQSGEIKSPQLTKKTNNTKTLPKNPHICKMCNESFSHLGDLNKHERFHTGEKPYPRKQYDKSFNQLTSPQSHQHIHMVEKHFQCEQCDMSFSNSTGLQEHKRTHTGEKPYQCEQCDKSFYHSGNLKRHEHVHTGEARTRLNIQEGLYAMEQKESDTAERSELVSEDGKNIKSVLCQRCGSKVLCPGSAAFTQRELFLPSMRKKTSLSGSSPDGSSEGDTPSSHWLVDDMYVFENVGFTKDVGRIKYLICADCEIGPIGWHCLDDKKSYVAVERVNHA